MIISRTPYRISFFGGGTDYPAWYREHGGAVLSAAINKYCYINCRFLPPFFEHRTRIVYSKIESCHSVEEIQHPAVRAVLQLLNEQRGLEIHHDGDLPARSGMGSSSSFTVGLLNALYALQGKMPDKHRLAMESIYVEQEMLQETVGVQDQITAAYGGFNHLTFAPDGAISVRPMTLPRERLEEFQSHLMLFYTGIVRTASNIAGSYVGDMSRKETQLCAMQAMVGEAMDILTGDGPIKAIGDLLHEAWQLKRSLGAKISNPQVEDIYDAARRSGALGGKLTGAGGGGFMLLFVPPEAQARVREALPSLLRVPVRFESSGSQIIFYDPREDYTVEEAWRADHPVEAFREWEEPKES